MKIKVTVLIMILLLTFSVIGQAAEIKDVPRDHWAYDSVQQLIDRGYLSLYSDGTFKGNEKVSRYELAEIIARMLNNMEAGTQELSEEDVDVIRKLSLEFRDELVAVAQNQKVFEDRIKKVEQKNMIQDEDIGNVNDRVSSLEGEVSDIIDQVVEIKNLQEEVTSLSSRISDLEQELALTKRNIGVDGELASSSTIQNLQDSQSVAMTKINQLENRISDLEEQLEVKNQKLAEKKGSGNTAYILGGLALLALLL
ncbi:MULTISPECIES: S-layer homology domain-containing protein [unclassified Halanaerobium]|uniref:S-layer homology domain-containing protein n=1 Tax=unclassified Halanaerobium TaxID=2641197 RepID=UPI000DF46A26|nr:MULTISPECIES: S-layer homology domain-containing protein [unclassified Halanaerobium]RCW51501.1 S-layer family protein [Halanaerobium sp. MA284_MarDTE_T2]RCW89289.1 S-layer family protein [Halanaerobium sp. DL-01]